MDITTDSRASEALHELFIAPTHDPFPLYDELRELGDGVHYIDGMGAYIAFRYADVLQIARDPELFSNDYFLAAPPGMHDPDDAEHRRFVEVSATNLMFKDPPVHTALRRVVREAFTPQNVRRWVPLIEDAVDELLVRFEPGQEIDLVRDLAGEVPVAVISSILGVPVDDRSKFREWSFAFASTYDPAVQGADRDRCIRAGLELIDYLSEIAEQRRVTPTDDLTSMLVHARPDGEQTMGHAELLGQLTILLVAGNDTTTNLVANGTTILLEHPEAQARLAADATLIPSAIEEMLRYDPPLHLDGRLVKQDTVVGETEVPAGSLIFLALPAANRDPRVYAEPRRFDLTRERNHHLSFLHGIHFCVGAPLARLEGQILFEKLLGRFGELKGGSRPPVRRTSNVVARGWESRPVTLG